MANGVDKVTAQEARLSASQLSRGTFTEESGKIPKLKEVPTLKVVEIDQHVENLLKRIVTGKHVLRLQKDTPAFSQGDAADAIYFIQSGKVKISVVSAEGKEAVLAMLGPREFFGEGCLVGQVLRISTATTVVSSTIFRVQKEAMLLGLYAQPEMAETFTAALLARNINLEEELCAQLFDHSEKRLARVLIKLSRLGRHPDMPDAKMPRLSHETLAGMVGTTRSRITFFMNKFRKLGLIEYKGAGDITVREELIADVVLHD